MYRYTLVYLCCCFFAFPCAGETDKATAHRLRCCFVWLCALWGVVLFGKEIEWKIYL